MPRLATFLTAAVARQLMRNIHCCSTLHTSARLHSHVSSSAAIVQARLSPQSLASLGRFDRLSVLRELALGRRVHSTTERRVALASAQKPLAHNSMKQGSSKQATVPTVSAPPRSKGRKPAAAAVPNAARDAGSAQISSLILEQHHISESAEPPQPEIVVETAGLAKALELTGSAEPKKKLLERALTLSQFPPQQHLLWSGRAAGLWAMQALPSKPRQRLMLRWQVLLGLCRSHPGRAASSSRSRGQLWQQRTCRLSPWQRG